MIKWYFDEGTFTSYFMPGYCIDQMQLSEIMKTNYLKMWTHTGVESD